MVLYAVLELFKLSHCFQLISEPCLRRYVNRNENYHVHLTTREQNPWRERLIRFRDALLTHPEIAREYMHLKYHLAQSYPNDRFAYGRAKDDFIQAVVINTEPFPATKRAF